MASVKLFPSRRQRPTCPTGVGPAHSYHHGDRPFEECPRVTFKDYTGNSASETGRAPPPHTWEPFHKEGVTTLNWIHSKQKIAVQKLVSVHLRPPPRALAQRDTVKAERVLVEQPLSDRLLLNYGNSENQSFYGLSCSEISASASSSEQKLQPPGDINRADCTTEIVTIGGLLLASSASPRRTVCRGLAASMGLFYLQGENKGENSQRQTRRAQRGSSVGTWEKHGRSAARLVIEHNEL
ncbi:unnamed protein product [Pleuronectes platessa]|uniref:Uncharacterized protein n=1 Tax=Pleuronectes platessa TaxID=8262 RepID=A0A9N7TWQ6_PLEPL|nr:unnamed protein product [Pleuronectes platessa]